MANNNSNTSSTGNANNGQPGAPNGNPSGNANNGQPGAPGTSNTGTTGPINAEICRICLEPITERSLTDTCLHAFCLTCLRQWADRHDVCPFCRRVFRNILANYVSNTDFRIIPVARRHHPNGQNPFNANPNPNEENRLLDILDRLNEIQTYMNFQEDRHVLLFHQLNYLDPNSIEYLERLQAITNLEMRINENRHLQTQLVAQLRQLLRENPVLNNFAPNHPNAGPNPLNGQPNQPNDEED